MSEFVVVGVDGSTQAASAVQWGAREAQARGIELRLVHVWSGHAHMARDVQTRGATAERAEREGRGLLEIAAVQARQTAPGVQVGEELVPGVPSRQLVEVAGDASMIVVGMRGRGGFASLLLGSTAQRIAARSACPVVVLGNGTSAPSTGHVVLGLDVHRPGDAGLRFAFDAAARREAELHVVYGWAVDDTTARITSGSNFDLDELRAAQQRALTEALAPWGARYPQVKVVDISLDATGDAALVGASVGAGLLVIGARRPAAGPRHLGPIAHSVLRHAACPVAVVPEV